MGKRGRWWRRSGEEGSRWRRSGVGIGGGVGAREKKEEGRKNKRTRKHKKKEEGKLKAGGTREVGRQGRRDLLTLKVERRVGYPQVSPSLPRTLLSPPPFPEDATPSTPNAPFTSTPIQLCPFANKYLQTLFCFLGGFGGGGAKPSCGSIFKKNFVS